MPSRHAGIGRRAPVNLGLYAIVLLIGAFCVAATAAGKNKPPVVLGITLGQSRINDVVYVLGSPKAVYLAGEDSEGSNRNASDPLVLRYETTFELRQKHNCQARVFVDPASYVAKVLSISFEYAKPSAGSKVMKSDIEAVYGRDYRTIHRRLEYDDGGMEARVGNCDDPQGEVESLLYPTLGLEVWIENKTGVRSLSFSYDVWSGAKTIDRCAGPK